MCEWKLYFRDNIRINCPLTLPWNVIKWTCTPKNILYDVNTVKPLISGQREEWTPPFNGQKLGDRSKLVQVPYKKNL